jgi:hypothetical protein
MLLCHPVASHPCCCSPLLLFTVVAGQLVVVQLADPSVIIDTIAGRDATFGARDDIKARRGLRIFDRQAGLATRLAGSGLLFSEVPVGPDGPLKDRSEGSLNDL